MDEKGRRGVSSCEEKTERVEERVWEELKKSKNERLSHSVQSKEGDTEAVCAREGAEGGWQERARKGVHDRKSSRAAWRGIE